MTRPPRHDSNYRLAIGLVIYHIVKILILLAAIVLLLIHWKEGAAS